MKLIYQAKWIIVVLFAITLFFSFAVHFAGGTTKINWCLLVANILLIFAQTANVVYAFRNKYKEVGYTFACNSFYKYRSDVVRICHGVELYR